MMHCPVCGSEMEWWGAGSDNTPDGQYRDTYHCYHCEETFYLGDDPEDIVTDG